MADYERQRKIVVAAVLALIVVAVIAVLLLVGGRAEVAGTSVAPATTSGQNVETPSPPTSPR